MQVSKTDLKIYQNDDFIALLDYLKKFSSRIYLVGGCVRDHFLGRASADVDVELYDVGPHRFEQIMQDFGAQGVGKSYFVYKYKNFDVSLPRTESKTGIGHKGFSVALATDEHEASRRRDFTINAMMIDAISGKVLDFYGGLADLHARILRVVDPHTFVEDSLRVYRAVQFAARFELRAEPRTLELMHGIDVSDLSCERVKAELIKFFRAPAHRYGMMLMQELGLYERVFGLRIDPRAHERLIKFIEHGESFVRNEMFFLYAFLNFLGLDKNKILKNLGLNSFYKRLLSEPFFKRVSDEQLCKIALKMPLKQWLGLYDKGRMQASKRLGIWDKKFKSLICAADVARNLRGAAIGKEIERLQEAEIRAFVAALKA
nr:CCA tRNA nucleotidyltransferase [uncultured Campylobacter sp.]